MTASASLDAESLAVLEESLLRYGVERYGFDVRKRFLQGTPAFNLDAWSDYAQLGWLVLALPERLGGLDGHPSALGSLMRYAGRALALEPLLSSAVIGSRLLARSDTPKVDGWMERIGDGKSIVVFAHAEDAHAPLQRPRTVTLRNGRLSGKKSVTLHANCADRLLVSARRDEDGAVAVASVEAGAAGMNAHAIRLLDGRDGACLEFDETPATVLDFCAGAEQAITEVHEEAKACLCAEAQGVASALIEQTTAYVKTRKQFGRTIGSNQVIQHRLVDLFVLGQEIDAVTRAAQRSLLSDDANRTVAISGAVAHSISAIRRIAQECLQFHGGVGMTDELPISHYFRRAMLIERVLGDRETHLDTFARAVA